MNQHISEDNLKMAIREMEEKVGVTKGRDMFISFHIQTTETKEQGFGNTIIKVYPETYENNIAKFIQHVEEALAHGLELQHKTKFQVKVLFFR